MATTEVFTAREVAPKIRRSYQTVLLYARTGVIRASKPNGGSYLFDQEAIDDFLAGKTPAAVPVPPRQTRHPKYAGKK